MRLFFIKVKDVARRPVHTVKPDDSMAYVAKLMYEKRIGSLIVMRNGKIIGIITERDLLRLNAQNANLVESKVSDFMTKDVVVCNGDASIEHALHTMSNKNIRHLPIIENDVLIGILSYRDIGWLSLQDATLFLNRLLHIYCKSVASIVNTGAIVFIPKFVDEVISIMESRGIKLLYCEKAAEALKRSQKILLESIFTGSVEIETLAGDKFLVKVKDCPFAHDIHPSLTQSRIICPQVVLLVAMTRKMTHRDIKIFFTQIKNGGSETEITFS